MQVFSLKVYMFPFGQFIPPTEDEWDFLPVLLMRCPFSSKSIRVCTVPSFSPPPNIRQRWTPSILPMPQAIYPIFFITVYPYFRSCDRYDVTAYHPTRRSIPLPCPYPPGKATCNPDTAYRWRDNSCIPPGH